LVIITIPGHYIGGGGGDIWPRVDSWTVPDMGAPVPPPFPAPSPARSVVGRGPSCPGEGGEEGGESAIVVVVLTISRARNEPANAPTVEPTRCDGDVIHG